ncbi:MAG: hypothetical protein JO270_10460 [Acidobacteriaceae bacterium]|nr:hypothetical protein [Acidobacteriaceae bacterium]MBV8571307.1 hypothetical protein [Acidobacteriaceae bacterium]
MCRILFSALATLIVPVGLFAQAVAPGPSDAFQIRYAANLNLGDSVIDITNAGTLNGYDPTGTICVNMYAFDPNEEEISCCTCRVTPNGLNSVSVNGQLASNPLTPAHPTSVVIKLLASNGAYGCNAAAPGPLVSGLRAWGTTLHKLPSGGVALTETEFAPATLSATELGKITSYCGFIQANGSGFGICAGCSTGGLAVAK